MNKVLCPHCDSEYVSKSGQKNGKQRYQCKACRKKFTQGLYIKQEIGKTTTKKKKTFNNRFKTKHNKIFDFGELTVKEYDINKEINIPSNIHRHVVLNECILRVIENDIKNNAIRIEKYKKIIEKLSSEEENEIANRLASIEKKEIELCMNKNLFKEHRNEKLDALIIKILIASGEDGMKMLLEYVNNTIEYKMTKYNFNVIGKHMSQNLSISWRIIKQYIKNGISKNCAYTITRYINYVSKLNYKELKNNLIFEEIRNIFVDKKLNNIFVMTKISDSDYLDNFSEYHYSLMKILDKMAKRELVNYDYLEQYNNSIFTDNAYIERCLEGDCLTKTGKKIIGNQMNIFHKEYSDIKYRCLQKEFDKWLDNYSNYIYKTILQYGVDRFEEFFSSDWGREFVFRCKISTRETEKLAEKICEEYFKNPRKDYSNIIDEVFHNLLYSLNEKAIDTFIYMIDNEIVVEEDDLFYQNASFPFVLGVTEKFYGDFYNIKTDYSYRRIHCGIIWEKMIGNILNQKYESIVYHPILDNNKIPDYAFIKENNLEKIVECKLILGFKELKETILKYHSYCNIIEFYCLRNDIDEEIINGKEYKELMRIVSKKFRYEIKDFNEIYKEANRYEDALLYFEKNLKKVTQKNLLKEKICTYFVNDKKEKILYLLDNTFTQSELF